MEQELTPIELRKQIMITGLSFIAFAIFYKAILENNIYQTFSYVTLPQGASELIDLFGWMMLGFGNILFIGAFFFMSDSNEKPNPKWNPKEEVKKFIDKKDDD